MVQVLLVSSLSFFRLCIAQIRQARPIETVLTTSKTDERGNLVVLKAFLLHAPNHFQFFLRNGRFLAGTFHFPRLLGNGNYPTNGLVFITLQTHLPPISRIISS